MREFLVYRFEFSDFGPFVAVDNQIVLITDL